MERMPDRYVVVLEIPSTGYVDCVAICDTAERAYGEAYLALCGDMMNEENCYITLPADREGENGMVMELVNRQTGEVYQTATVLFYFNEKGE